MNLKNPIPKIIKLQSQRNKSAKHRRSDNPNPTNPPTLNPKPYSILIKTLTVPALKGSLEKEPVKEPLKVPLKDP